MPATPARDVLDVVVPVEVAQVVSRGAHALVQKPRDSLGLEIEVGSADPTRRDPDRTLFVVFTEDAVDGADARSDDARDETGDVLDRRPLRLVEQEAEGGRRRSAGKSNSQIG